MAKPGGDTERNPLAGITPEPPASWVSGLGEVGQRARRSDATGRKKDYHKDTEVIAVRLPSVVAEQLRRAAQGDGLSVNTWLAELIESELAARRPGKP